MDVKDIKSIEQLIKFLDERYLRSKDSVNYGEELASMREMKKVPSIVKKCKKIKYAIRFEPYYFRNDDDNILWTYLNECIVSCYERSNSKSKRTFRDAYINVRQIDNETNIKKRLVEIATSRGIDVSKTCHKIDEAWGKYFHYMKEIRQYPYDSNGYKQILPKIQDAAYYLIDSHYVPSEIYYDLHSGSLECDIFFNYCFAENKEQESEDELKKSKKSFKSEDLLVGCGGLIGFSLFIAGLLTYPLITLGVIALLFIVVWLYHKYYKQI